MKKTNKDNLIERALNKIIPSDKGMILFLKILLIVLFAVISFQTALVRADDDDADEEEIEETEGEIDDYEDDLEDLEEEEAQQQNELNRVSQDISVTQSAINQTSHKIETYEEEIEEKEEVIKTKEENIEFKQKILAEYLRLFRRNSLEVGLITFDFNQDLGEYLREIESFESFQTKINEALAVIEQEREEVAKEKEEVEDKKEEKEEVLQTQEQQKRHLVYQENQKQQILNQTKASISEVKSKISKLKSELSALLGEGYDTDDIKDAIKYANKKTGVSKGFLFGMLSMESGLGRYTGGCTYDEVKSGAKAAYKDGRLSKSSYETMKWRKDIFEEIVDELGYDEDEKLVSCNPSSYAGTGGAMGVAQFMSDTWRGYEDKISDETGKKTPDPWDLFDGVMAMAIKLENDGAAESGDVRITSPCDGDKEYVDWEDYAAMKYLGWSCYALTNYAPAIQNLKDGYDDL